MMDKKVADLIADALHQVGLLRIYGIAGDSLNSFTDALRRRGGMAWVHARHEETVAFAAGADAALTGELAVCAGSCGPGNLHLVNGLFDRQRSRVPVLAVPAKVAIEYGASAIGVSNHGGRQLDNVSGGIVALPPNRRGSSGAGTDIPRWRCSPRSAHRAKRSLSVLPRLVLAVPPSTVWRSVTGVAYMIWSSTSSKSSL